MFLNKSPLENPVYLCTVNSEFEADLIDSKLNSEKIRTNRLYEEGNRYMETIMGQTVSYPIKIFVSEKDFEDAKNIILPVDLDDCDLL